MVRIGEKVKLECEVDGAPNPELSWTHDGRPIEETKNHKVRRGGDYFGTSREQCVIIALDTFRRFRRTALERA